MEQIKELDTILNYKKVAQSIKITAKNLERMQKDGAIMETTRIKAQVPDTPYSIVYKVKNNPKQILIAKRIIRHK